MRSDGECPEEPYRVLRQAAFLENTGANGIVDIVIDVRHDVGDAGNLPLDGAGAELRGRADRQAALALGVPRDAVPDFPRQVEPFAVVLEHIDDAEALLVVIEPARHKGARAPVRRRGQTACGRGRGRAQWLRSALRAVAAPWRSCARSARPRACESAACGSGRPAGEKNTCVLCLRRRNALVWMIRSRSRWNAGRIGSSASGRSRPLLSALLAACGARISRSRAPAARGYLKTVDS